MIFPVNREHLHYNEVIQVFCKWRYWFILLSGAGFIFSWMEPTLYNLFTL